MLYAVASLASLAFSPAGVVLSNSRVVNRATPVMDSSWRRSFDGRGTGVVNPVLVEPKPEPSPVPAMVEVMTVEQACVFMAEGSASTADKKAFLAAKGVSDFVLAQAECVAPEDNVQGHPELPGAAAGGDEVMTVEQACIFMADGSASTADKKAFLAAKGVSAFVLAQAECVSPENNVQGHPELPGAAAGGDEVMTVEQACVFMADGSASTADKKAYLAAKGVSPFVLAQAECVAPENNVKGHPALPGAAAGGDEVMTVEQACVFMADGSASTADKKAFLAAKGVSPFVLAQAECVAPENNVKGHPALPGAAAGGDEVMTVEQACIFMADGSASTADKKAFLAAKGVSPFVLAQAECVAPENNVQGHPELPGAAAGGDEVMTVEQACVFMADGSASTADKKAFLAAKGVSPFVLAQAECVSPEDNVQGHPGLPGAADVKGVVVPTLTAATAEQRISAELYKMAPAEALAHLTKERDGLIAAGVAAADIDEAQKVIEECLAAKA